MADYRITPNGDRYDIRIAGANGARQTVLGFASQSDAEAWVAQDKRLRLETVIDPAMGTVLTDRDKLDKMTLNLVFNAMKFTPSGGRVELRKILPTRFKFLIPYFTGTTRRSGAPCSGASGRPFIS